MVRKFQYLASYTTLLSTWIQKRKMGKGFHIKALTKAPNFFFYSLKWKTISFSFFLPKVWKVYNKKKERRKLKYFFPNSFLRQWKFNDKKRKKKKKLQDDSKRENISIIYVTFCVLETSLGFSPRAEEQEIKRPISFCCF